MISEAKQSYNEAEERDTFASLRSTSIEEVEPIPELEEIISASTNRDAWVVLVAGEHCDNTCLGAHTSIEPIGMAYNILRRHYRRDRIIVIAQVEECRRWHDLETSEKVKRIEDPERIKAQEVMWADRKKSFQRNMKKLIEEGGADYDGRDVNYDTFLNVLIGRRSEKYPVAIDYREGETRVFVSMFSHGSWNGKHENHYFWMPYPSPPVLEIMQSRPRPVYVPEQTQESKSADEANAVAEDAVAESETLPVPDRNPSESVTGDADAIIDSVDEANREEKSIDQESPPQIETITPSSEGFGPLHGCEIEDFFYRPINSYTPLTDEETAEPKRYFRMHIHRNKPDCKKPPRSDEEFNTADSCVLHWQFLFEALKRVFTVNKPKSIFIFQQSCGSGGMWNWLGNEKYESEYSVSRWPLYVAYTAEPETSAIGSCWSIFHDILDGILINNISRGSKHLVDIEQQSIIKSTKSTEGDSIVHREVNEGEKVDEAVDDLPEPQPSLPQIKREFSNGETLTGIDLTSDPPVESFFDFVKVRYYAAESYVYDINIRLTSEERVQSGFERFGVLGSAFGEGSGVERLGTLDLLGIPFQ